MSVGIHPEIPTFDLFYFNTTIMSFIVMVMLAMFLFTIYLGTVLSDDKQEIYHNFPIFFFLYPMIVPLYLARAVFDTFTKRKNVWVLQDTKR